MASPEKLDALIKEIAVRHGVALGKDDPILILQTINEYLMKDSAASQQAIVDEFKSELEGIAHRWSEEARHKAERILNAALNASRDAMSEDMETAAINAAGAIQRKIDSSHGQMMKFQRRASIIALINLTCSALVLLAALVIYLTAP